MEHSYNDFDDEQTDGTPSKSELKRQSAAGLMLGEELLSLTEAQLASLDLPDELKEAVTLGRSITAHGGLKRQKKYIGKLLRQQDMDIILSTLHRFRHQENNATYQHHALERWRDRLLDEGITAINAYMAENPGADRQKLRQLVRDATREREKDAPPHAARQLFRYLRSLHENAALP